MDLAPAVVSTYPRELQMLAYLFIAGIAYGVASWACSASRSYWQATPGFLFATVCGWLGGTLILAAIFSVIGGDVARVTSTYLGRGIAIALTGAVFGVSRARSRLAARDAADELESQTTDEMAVKTTKSKRASNTAPSTNRQSIRKVSRMRWIGGGILVFNLVIIGQYNLTGLPVLLMTFGFAIFYELVVVRRNSNFESIKLANEVPDIESTMRTANGTGLHTSPNAFKTANTGQKQPDFADTDPNERAIPASLKTTADQEEVYAQVAKEIESGLVDRGLWARLLVQSEGDENRTKVLYLKQRAERFFAARESRHIANEPPAPREPTVVKQEERYVAPSVVPEGDGYSIGRAAGRAVSRLVSGESESVTEPVRRKSVALLVAMIVVICALVMGIVFYVASQGTPERRPQVATESTQSSTPEARPQALTPSWNARVLDLVARVVSGEVPGINGFTSSTAPANRSEWALEDALALESNQMSWIQSTNKPVTFFIHLRNQTAMDLSGAALQYQDGTCNEGAAVNIFYLTLERPIPPGGQAVVNYRMDFPVETKGPFCMVIARVWK